MSEVTFLIADVEGSTQLLGQLGDERYEAIIEQLRSILGDAVDRNAGAVHQFQGDGVIAVFADAGDALRASVDIQRALATRPFPYGIDLRVRIGAHTGPVRQTADGDWVGMVLHQASRLVAAGHGGQIVVSSSTRDAAAARLPDDAEVVDAGRFHVRDFADPERIFLVHHLDVPRVDKPLRVPAARVHNLSHPRTDLIGRHDEVEELTKSVATAELVTIVGPGGIGKTRLAAEVAQAVTSQFEDGVWFIDLTTIDDGARLDGAVAAVLGVGPSADGPREMVRAWLADRQVLLVLDNCEHVIDAAADLVLDVLSASDRSAALVTSREPLGLRAERVVRIEPLGHSDAAALFGDRAAALGRPIRDEEAALVARIVARVDALPLALELAASRLRDHPLATVADDVDAALVDLAGGYRGDAPRHRTLRALLVWTVDRLTGPEREALARLGVFVGAFPTAAARAVLDDSVPVRSLVRRSLIEPVGDDDEWCRMLQPVRELALELLLGSGLEHEARRAHFTVWRGRAGSRRSSADAATDVAWFSPPEAANATAALAWAVEHDPDAALDLANSLAPHLERLGRFAEGQEWLVRAVAAASPSHPARRLALVSAATLAQTRGDMAAARALWTQADAAPSADDDDAARGAVNASLAVFDLLDGAAQDALPRLVAAIEQLERAGRVEQVAGARLNLAHALVRLGRAPEAAALMEESLFAATARGDRRAAAQARTQLGAIRGMTGDHAGARAAFEEALVDARATGDDDGQAWLLYNLSFATLNCDDVDAGRPLLAEAVETARRLGNQRLLALALSAAAQLADADGDGDRAHDFYDEAGVAAGLVGDSSRAAINQALQVAVITERAGTSPTAAADRLAAAAAAVGADPSALAEIAFAAARTWVAEDPHRSALLAGAASAAAPTLLRPAMERLTSALAARLGADEVEARRVEGAELAGDVDRLALAIGGRGLA